MSPCFWCSPEHPSPCETARGMRRSPIGSPCIPSMDERPMVKDAWQAERVSGSLRVASAATLALAALVATTDVLPGLDPQRPTFLFGLAFLTAIGLAGHTLATPITAAVAGKFSTSLYRSVVGVVSIVIGFYVLIASTPLVGPPSRSAVLALIATAAVQAYGCTRATDCLINGILGAGTVGMTILTRPSGLSAVALGLLWAAAFAGQLMLAHRHELATKIAHPAEMSVERVGMSQEPWVRTLVGTLGALLVLGLLAILLPAIKTAFEAKGRESSSTASPTSSSRPTSSTSVPTGTNNNSSDPRPTSGPYNKSDPRPGASSTSSSQTQAGGSNQNGARGERGAGVGSSAYSISGLDLYRVEPQGDSSVFAVMKAREPRLMRATAFSVYSGNAFLSTDAVETTLQRCPCTLPVSRESSAPFDEYEQAIELIAAYDGPLPAAFEARRVWFRSDPGPGIRLAHEAALVPNAPVKAGFAYTVQSEVPDPEQVDLAMFDGPIPREVAAQGLQLPEGYSDRVRHLAESITKGKKSPYEKAMAIIEYVVDKHQFTVGAEGRDPSRDAVEDYIFGRGNRGTGDDAVAAAVVMMRTVGVPARIGFGYRPTPLGTVGTPPSPSSASSPGLRSAPTTSPSGRSDVSSNDRGTLYALDRAERTTWVEVYVSGFGWVTQDIQPLLGQAKTSGSGSHLITALIALLVFLIAAIITVVAWHKFRRRRSAHPESEAFDLMRMLENAVGIVRNPSQTPSEYGAVLWARLPSAQRELAMQVVTAIVQLSYSKIPLSDTQRSNVYQALEKLAAARRERERQHRYAQRKGKRGA
ncbi:MAG: hypothetical protein C4319_00915 [Acidimicrobiia bacterium]